MFVAKLCHAATGANGFFCLGEAKIFLHPTPWTAGEMCGDMQIVILRPSLDGDDKPGTSCITRYHNHVRPSPKEKVTKWPITKMPATENAAFSPPQ